MDKNKYLDKRLIARSIRKGLLTREEVNAHLASLEDVEENATKLEAQLEHKYGQDTEESDDAEK